MNDDLSDGEIGGTETFNVAGTSNINTYEGATDNYLNVKCWVS